MGRLARELLAVSEPGAATLVPAMEAWYGVRAPHTEVRHGPEQLEHLELLQYQEYLEYLEYMGQL